MIFVFGSNEAGRHGRGAAKVALREHGAKNGHGIGRQGNSYAIPTKDRNLKVLKTKVIKEYVKDFLQYAREHPEEQFQITQIGCGLAGFKPHQIAPMFQGAPENCLFDAAWVQFLPEGTLFWGSY